jgi:hypothetical protein
MEEKAFWDIIENNFGMYDELDEDEANLFEPYKQQNFTIINPTPGIIIMIKDEFYGEI